MLDWLYGLVLRLFPPDWSSSDRREMWETYRSRIETVATSGRSTLGVRLLELADLLGALATALTPHHLLDGLRQDLRVGIRSLVRTPLVSGLAVLSLALGIGASSAIFSSVDVWLIRPLPLPNADRLVAVHMANRGRGWMANVFSVRDYADWAEQSTAVELAAYRPGGFSFVHGERIERVDAMTVSANLARVLGLEPHLGRRFLAEEGRAGAPRVALLEYEFWRGDLGADSSVVDTPIILDGVPHMVVGVLPEGQGLPHSRSDLWVPLRISGSEPRSGHNLWGIGLLADGVSLGQAREELEAVADRVALLDPERTFPDAFVRPIRDVVYGPEFQQGGLLLGGAVLFVLLIACANIANLLRARGLGRRHEVAVRGALGAGRPRIVRQFLVESLLIAGLGGLLGLGVAHAGIEMLVAYVLPADVPGIGQIRLDGRVIAATVVLVVAAAVLFGLAPALRASRTGLRDTLAAGGRGGSGRGTWTGNALVAAEIALSLALLTSSGLLIRELVELQRIDLGFDTADALEFRLSVPSTVRDSMPEVVAFYRELEERLREAPEILESAITTGVPIGSWSSRLYSLPGDRGAPESPEASRRSAQSRRVTPGFAVTMGFRLLSGRWLTDADGAGDPRVAVVTRPLAEEWWGSPASAISRRVVHDGMEREIVGVLEAGRLLGPAADPPPVIFEPFAQEPARSVFVALRHRGDARAAAETVRSVLQSMAPQLAAFSIAPLEASVAEAVGAQRAGLRILAALALVALLLTVVGVYGVTAFAVGRRRRELSVRMALGESASGLVRLVLGGSGRVAVLGLALGLGLSLVAGRALAFLLVGVSPYDPVVLSAVGGLLLVAVMLASFLPALQAGRADPVEALKAE